MGAVGAALFGWEGFDEVLLYLGLAGSIAASVQYGRDGLRGDPSACRRSGAEFEPAQQCYLAALKLRGKSRLEEVNVRRHLGALYLSPTVLHDRERGERYFREAIGLTSGQTDDYSRYSTGYTEEMLSMSLLANRYPGSEAAIQAARASYEAMDSRNVLRQAAIDSLNLRLQPTGQVIPVPPSTTPPRPPEVVTSP